MRAVSGIVYLLLFLINLPRRAFVELGPRGTYWRRKDNVRRERRFY